MTQVNRMIGLFLAVLALTACDQQESANTVDGAATTDAVVVALDTTEERLSYSTAYRLGLRLKGDGVPLDVAAFNAGLSDAFGDVASRLSEEDDVASRLSEEDIDQEMQAFQQKRDTELQAEADAKSATNKVEGASFMAKNAIAEGVIVLESGLQYKVISEGTGTKPGAADQVEVHYEGKLLDGTVFDSSIARGTTVTFGVNQVIPGWTEALQLMPVGAKWQLFIPGDLAYGSGGAAGAQIGPNATLLFDVELIAIK